MEERARRNHGPTQTDVARLADVSQSVVSIVVNDKTHLAIAPATRRRVLDAIEQLGYVPDGTARSLRTRKTATIANVIPDITNPFYPAFERGIHDVAESHDYDLITYNSDGLRAKEVKCLRSVLRGRVDGLIITPFQLTLVDFGPLLDRQVPIVVFGDMAHETSPIPFDRLSVDNVAAARAVVTFLIGRGHSRIGMIAGPPNVPRRESRVRGYRQALKAHRIALEEVLIRGGDFREAGGYQAMWELLKLSPRPTAVFAANDLMAMGALAALREAGLRVPEDVAVAGFDDVFVARLLSPPLTTVAQFPEHLGRRAADMLFDRLAGTAPEEGRHTVMPFELVIRSST